MEKTASLVALVIIILMPLRSWCREETYKPLAGAKPAVCVGKDAELKRFDDIDYDSFVSLMGRRSADQSNRHRNIPISRKRHMDRTFTDLLGRTRSNTFFQDVKPRPVTNTD